MHWWGGSWLPANRASGSSPRGVICFWIQGAKSTSKGIWEGTFLQVRGPWSWGNVAWARIRQLPQCKSEKWLKMENKLHLLGPNPHNLLTIINDSNTRTWGSKRQRQAFKVIQATTFSIKHPPCLSTTSAVSPGSLIMQLRGKANFPFTGVKKHSANVSPLDLARLPRAKTNVVCLEYFLFLWTLQGTCCLQFVSWLLLYLYCERQFLISWLSIFSKSFSSQIPKYNLPIPCLLLWKRCSDV